MKLGAAIADTDSEAHDRVAMNAGQPLGRADRAAFGQGRDDSYLLVVRKNVHGAIHDAELPLKRVEGAYRYRYIGIHDHRFRGNPWVDG